MSTNVNVELSAQGAAHLQGGPIHGASPYVPGTDPAPNSEETQSANRAASESDRSVRHVSRIQDCESDRSSSRRNPQAIDKKRKSSRKPVPRWLREFVHNRATHLFCVGDEREISSVIREDLRSRGHKISEAEIDHILIGNALEHERWRNNISSGWKNITEMAGEAAEGVWEAA